MSQPFQEQSYQWFRETTVERGENDLDPPDIHVRGAMLIFGVPRERVTPEMRAEAKRRAFVWLYSK